MKKIFLVFFTLLISLFLVGCNNSNTTTKTTTTTTSSNDKKIAVGSYYAYDITRNILGSDESLTYVKPIGTPGHAYTLSPKNSIDIQNASLLILNNKMDEDKQIYEKYQSGRTLVTLDDWKKDNSKVVNMVSLSKQLFGADLVDDDEDEEGHHHDGDMDHHDEDNDMEHHEGEHDSDKHHDEDGDMDEHEGHHHHHEEPLPEGVNGTDEYVTIYGYKVKNVLYKSAPEHARYHFYLDLEYAVPTAKIILTALLTQKDLTQEQKDKYTANFNSYIQKLQDLQNEFAQKVKAYPYTQELNMFFVGHDAVAGFSYDFGLNIHALDPTIQEDNTVNADQLAKYVDAIKASHIYTIFKAELNEDANKVQKLKEGLNDPKYQFVEFNSLHNVTQKQFNDKLSFIDIMKSNMSQVEKCIQQYKEYKDSLNK